MRAMWFVAVVLGFVGTVGCQKGGVSATGSGTTPTTPTVDNAQDAITKAPAQDPTSVDVSNSESTIYTSSVSQSKLEHRSKVDAQVFNKTLYIKLKVVKDATTGARTISAYQCSSTDNGTTRTQDFYLQMGLDADNLYTSSIRYYTASPTFVPNSYAQFSIPGFTEKTNSDFVASASVTSSNGTVEMSTTNGVTVLKGAKDAAQIYCAWDTDSGCAKVNGLSDAVGFTMSVNSSTNKKTFSDGSDTSLCADPSYVTAGTVSDFSGDEVWDCQAGTGYSFTDAGSAPSVEDEGGPGCVESTTSIFDQTTFDETSCGSGTTGSAAGCICEQIMGTVIKDIRKTNRAGKCKAFGLVKLIGDGTITGLTIEDDNEYYLTLSLGQ